MKRYLICVFMISGVLGFALAECAGAVDVYTFKKERVDQELKGNRGYLMGQPPAVETSASRKRTLIGVDVEVPFTSSCPEEDMTSSEEPVKSSDFQPETQTVVSSSDGSKVEVIDVSSDGEEMSRRMEFQDESEDEWIK
jgi:hypothetical protein